MEEAHERRRQGGSAGGEGEKISGYSPYLRSGIGPPSQGRTVS